MIYITGDTHREFSRLDNYPFNENDMLIILGDSAINYYINDEDKKVKEYLNNLNIKFFCVRENHEERPSKIKGYKEVDMFDGKVYIEKEYPNLIFPKDGEVYNIDGKSVLVIGGAYSIDKFYRIFYGYQWFRDEQLSRREMNNILKKVKGKHFDVVLTHTCPFKYEPTEVFLPGLNQSRIDKSMEHFLDKVEENIDYNKWYCGHFHTKKQIDKLEFMFEDIKEFNQNIKLTKKN